MSWYIRPLFIIPIIVFAFKKSYTGIFVSIFALFTSMFWFPVPEASSSQVLEFLAFEMEYLKGTWTAAKILMSLAVPLFFIMLIIAAWKRNWKWLLGVIDGKVVTISLKIPPPSILGTNIIRFPINVINVIITTLTIAAIILLVIISLPVMRMSWIVPSY